MHMPLVLTNRRRRGGSASAPAFSPSSLYSTGSQGIWLDPSDLSTMFSDRAGTTPVTTPGTVVGVRLDKSKGLVLGAELVSNPGPFANTTGWLTTSATPLAVSGGILTGTTAVATDGVIYGAWLGVSAQNKYFQITTTITALTGRVRFQIYGSNVVGPWITSPGTYTIKLYQTVANGSVGFNTDQATTVSVSAFSAKEISGNHAVAPTDAARPIYGVEPKGGRRNLLTWSEDFGNAVWTKNRSTVTSIGDGAFTLTQNATDFAGNINQTASITASQLFSVSVEAKSGTAGFLVIREQLLDGSANNTYFNLSSGTVGTTDPGHTAAITSLGDGWYRCSITATSDATARTSLVYFGIAFADNSGASSVSDNGKTISLRKTQYAFGALSAYQRVTTAYDITESGVAACHYVQYDGSDDSMSTAAIDFTGTDKMSVFAGVRANNNGAQTVVELSASTQANAGAFLMGAGSFVSGGNRMGGQIAGSTRLDYDSPANFPQPASYLVTNLYNIAGTTAIDEVGLRVNGLVQSPLNPGGSGSAGTGNFGNYPLFIGRRGNTTLPFNGRDYGLIVVGKAASAGEITDTETWLAARTSGVTI